MRCAGEATGSLSRCKARPDEHTGKCAIYWQAVTAPAKPPIYSCEVIQTACRALEALNGMEVSPGSHGYTDVAEATWSALRIIRDGIASHERAIKGEP